MVVARYNDSRIATKSHQVAQVEGMENVDRSDIKIAWLKLVQAQSEGYDTRKFLGSIVIAKVEKEDTIAMDTVIGYLTTLWHSRTRWPEGSTRSGSPICKSAFGSNGKAPQDPNAARVELCKDCQVPFKDCPTSINFAMMVTGYIAGNKEVTLDEPMVACVSFSGTGVAVAKTRIINFFLGKLKRQVPLFGMELRLSAKEASNDKGKFYAYDPIFSRKFEGEELEAAREKHLETVAWLALSEDGVDEYSSVSRSSGRPPMDENEFAGMDEEPF
jgi:hypothetical protein